MVAQRGSCLPVAGGRGTGRRRHRPFLHSRRRRSAQAGRRAGHGHQARLHPHHGHLRRHRRGHTRDVPEHQRSLGLGDATGRRAPTGRAGRLVTRADGRVSVVGSRLPDPGRHLEHVHPHARPVTPDPFGPGDGTAAGLPHRGHRLSRHGRGAAGHQLRDDGSGHLGTTDSLARRSRPPPGPGRCSRGRSPTSGTPMVWPSRAAAASTLTLTPAGSTSGSASR